MRPGFCLLLLCLVVSPLGAQTPTRRVTFHKSPAQPGDVSRQVIDCDLDLEMSIRQGGQVVQSQRQGLQRQQVRQLTILTASPQAATQAQVHYDRSSVAVRSPNAATQTDSQPVTGKTYLVTRDADQLQVTYPNGQTPPAEELQIVTSNMETFGLPNPISLYFDGKQIEVGQTVQLPTQLARELLGFSDTVDNVSDFRLKLVGIRPLENNSTAAVFQITLVAENPDETAMSMQLTGQLVMDTQSCRTVEVRLTGPIRASETHGPETASFQVCSEGTVRVAVEATYTPARR